MSTQEQILINLIQGEEGQRWATSRLGWSRNELYVPACDWTGVTCGEDGYTVTEIDLEDTDLIATIPASFGALTSLKSINLAINEVFGTIPHSVATLPFLENFDVRNNRIAGSVPKFSSALLSRVILTDNTLSGTLSANFGAGHPALVEIDVVKNQLTGSLPDSLGNLSKLSKLSVSENGFSGTIPESLGALRSLQYLYLDLNNFVGTVPRSLTPMDSSLREVWINGNLLSGTVPSAFADMENLMNLYVDGNKFTGTLPLDLCKPEINEDFFQGAALLERDYCSSIACPVGTVSREGVWPCDPCEDGTFSPYLGREESCIVRDEQEILNDLWLATNGHEWTESNNWFFGGATVCEFTGVTCNAEEQVISVSLPNFNLRGIIPESLGFLEHLQELDLSDNMLHGYVPSDLRFAPLDRLELGGNHFVGLVPPMLCLSGGVNGNGVNGAYNCDNILCPEGTYSPTGRAGDGSTCLPCHDAVEALGRKVCNVDGVPVIVPMNDGNGGGSSGGGIAIFVAALAASVLLFIALGIVWYSRKKQEVSSESSDQLTPERARAAALAALDAFDRQHHDQTFYRSTDGTTFHEDNEILIEEEEDVSNDDVDNDRENNESRHSHHRRSRKKSKAKRITPWYDRVELLEQRVHEDEETPTSVPDKSVT